MEYLKAWIWTQKKLAENGEEIDETLLKYVEKMFTQMQGLIETKLVKRTKTGNYELAQLADSQAEIKLLKNEIFIARELLVNSKPFVSTMQLHDWKVSTEGFLKRNENAKI